ncbi:DUF2461 domain-containing protein [Flagellimonas zhangzhouensis]|uniref:TIGR02453 family protein n=1 Tax=Flagellimonas zhangzhouensis TaxID=1073328 RepID=A0A1H2SLP6_9FLAO|nr:DUF2461 domain-containing protein [Allomuricauda zhangzhouensis]SDQ76501.1 TIGR02453 family protein [Allomuricauda zhangzhouensis]SDW32531.1 TIGR02453 family protein [Allomuricauda zhangzhouensis]
MASKITVSKEVFDFLSQLRANNNKEWFEENKPTFKLHEKSVKGFFESVKEQLEHHDEIEKMKMFRIYRDVRFSKDKTPYKSHLAASFSRLGAHLRGGYYVHLSPGDSMIATGFWAPNKEDLKRIRKELEMDANEFRDVIGHDNLKNIWGDLQGDELKTAPKGFDKDHPDIDLIKKQQYVFTRKFTDKEVLSDNFLDEVDSSFKAIRPYFDLMSDILTTNLNGESVL